MSAASEDKLRLRFLGSLIEELGAKMYPRVTASVAELVSNAWDADAENVWIEMPLGTQLGANSADEIVVTDDGIGMSRDDVRDHYLLVGRKRRLASKSWNSPSGRPLHGRKGVGKLAAFGTAKVLECTTIKNSEEATTFKLNYDAIRKLGPGEDYQVPESKNGKPITHPISKDPLDQGTRIRLTHLLGKRIPPAGQFKMSLARRFGILSPAMKVFLNGEPIERFDIPLDIRFPDDGFPPLQSGLGGSDAEAEELENPITVTDGWAQEQISKGQVRWWIGFTARPIKNPELRGIAVLAHEKMVQRPFMFGRSQGTVGQLGQEYLVGEVVADWIDDNIESEDDLIETNRNELQLEDERLQDFMAWGRERLKWALKRRNDLRTDRAAKKVLVDPNILDRLSGFTKREQGTFKNIARQMAGLPEVATDDIRDLLNSVMDAYDDQNIRELIDQIEDEDDPTQQNMWGLVAEFGLIDARRALTKIEARLEVIDKLESLVKGGNPEVPDIHKHLHNNPWLLDPRWDLYGNEVNLTRLLKNKQTQHTDKSGRRVDFVFAIGPDTPTSIDEIIVVEIKRGTNADGSPRKANLAELQKFVGYVSLATNYINQADDPSSQPVVKGLMVASGYTADAQNHRRELELVPGSRYQFKSWGSVLKDTNRLHRGWLKLSSQRAKASEDSPSSQSDSSQVRPESD